MERKKVALVTGASSGIGEATVILLANNGYKVYGAARRVEKMRHLKLAGIEILAMDISDDETMVQGVNEIIKREENIDILVNNAGFGSFGAVEDVAMKDARYQMEVNLIGLARLCQLILPHMRRQHSGKIINITSIGGKMATPMGGWYHASKFAVEGLSDSLRMEVKQFGIDVIVIEPGGVKTEWAGIAANHAGSVSGDTVYKAMADKAKEIDAAQDKFSEPVEIARTIQKAIEAKKPKARYSAGSMAGVILFLKKWLSDAAFDKFMMQRFK
ncbi:oxidoreductase [Mucilaginibacter endophyticus]|uniref:oxidoreductase n=1 Tax=Mucilaginibacter endophyticus TaxID=2675003 RepID=UPI000E0DB6B1|nr:oxidoreductase [Mucilaginibacter endophyticus]